MSGLNRQIGCAEFQRNLRTDRRGFLKAGVLGTAGLSLAQLLRVEAQADNSARPNSVIILWMRGGPSHIDMWDPKPEAPLEYRGEFGTMATRVPGITLSDMLPKCAQVMDKWSNERGVELDFSRPGKPTDNARVESFNGRLRQECLNAHWFLSLDDATAKISAWKRYYNESRPHSSLQWDTPAEFAQYHHQHVAFQPAVPQIRDQRVDAAVQQRHREMCAQFVPGGLSPPPAPVPPMRRDRVV
jgi:hypothetical protein